MTGQVPAGTKLSKGWKEPRAPRPRPLLHYLIAAALVTLVPGFIFAGILIQQNHAAQQATLQALMVSSARGVAQAVEREIAGNITTLRVLAASPSLRDGDFRGFHNRSAMALEDTQSTLFIVNPDYSTFARTRAPYDSPASRTNDPGAVQRAFDTGEPVVGDLIRGAVSGKWVYNVFFPAQVQGQGPKVIALSQEAARLGSAVGGNNLPEGWNAALLDGQGRVLAGTPEAGQRGDFFALPALLERPSYQGWRQVDTPAGSTLVVAQRLSMTGWTVAIWAPMWTTFQPLLISVLYLATGATLLLLLMLGGLFWFNRRITSSVGGLARDARRLGAGEEVWPRPYPVAEIAEVSRALSDASEQRRNAEAEIRFLMRELAHRSKNQMTVIAAMAKQTARGADNVQSYVDAFERRIMGLARSTDLLLATGRVGVSLQELVESQIGSFSPSDPDRIAIEGPPVRLNMQSAQILGMALHELSTNAVKYGAFRGEAGALRVEWTHGAEQLDLIWRETVPHPVVPSDRTGFGTTVLKTIVGGSLKADVTRQLHPNGIEWRFVIPQDSISPDQAAAALAAE